MRGVYGIDARAIVDARAYGVHQLLRLPLCSKAPQTVRTAPVPLVPVLPFARCRVPPPPPPPHPLPPVPTLRSPHRPLPCARRAVVAAWAALVGGGCWR